MKMANFILNLVSFAVLSAGVSIPMFSSFLVGVGGVMFGKSEISGTTTSSAWVVFSVLMIITIVAFVLLIESIVYFGNKNKVTAERYALFQYINAGITIAMCIIAVLMYYIFCRSLDEDEFTGWIILSLIPVFDIFVNVAVFIITVKDHKKSSAYNAGNINNGYINPNNTGYDYSGYNNYYR